MAERVLQFNQDVIDQKTFVGLLKERLATADMSQVKNDVLPFVKDVNELDIWSNDYFVQLADRMRIE